MTSEPRFEVRVLPAAADGQRVLLRAEVRSPDLPCGDLSFAIDESGAGLITDRADPFVVASLILAMAEGRDLVVTGAPVDSVLLRNLVEFQRIWKAWFGYDVIDVHAETIEPSRRSVDSVVAFSGGADSAFSAWWHTRGSAAKERPVRAALMAHGIDIPLDDDHGFASAAVRSKRMVASLGLDLITVDTNAWSFPVPIPHYTGMGVAAALHVVSGGFGAGLIPSTATYRDLVVSLNTSPVSDWLLGSSDFEIVHDGALYNRLEKLRFLSEWDEAMHSLRVCLVAPQHDRNCGRCHKCMMTSTAFRLIGIEPTCFDRAPSPDEIRDWARTLPSAAYYLQEGAFLVQAAEAQNVDEPWVRALRNRIRTARAKQAIRAAWPDLADGVASIHRRARRALPIRR